MLNKTLLNTMVMIAAITPSMTPTDASGASARTVDRLFISGHSLTDPPLPQQLAAMAASLGSPLQWNMQSIPGSSIRTRTQGAGPDHAYRHGANREGNNLHVLDEWRAPKTVTGGPYDTLLVAEQHGVLSALTWHDTVGALRGIHDDFTQPNPTGKTWFYEAWLGLDNKNDPSRWIAYERAAAPVWRCVVSRVNESLAARGRADRIGSVPSGAALAALIERATKTNMPGVSAGNTAATVARLLADDVHLTPLGSYYMASVVYATLWGRSPSGAVAADMDSQAAASLQQAAWEFVQSHQASAKPMSMAQCRALIKDSFIRQHWAYVRDTQWSKELGTVGAYSAWMKQLLAWHWRIRKTGSDNPFAD